MPTTIRPAGRDAATLRPYLQAINDTPLLTRDEERELARRVARGDAAARDHLARANLRLVVFIARDYTRRGLPLEDLIAEGNLGLMRAVEGFDPDAGAGFSTYASYWIKQSIRSALRKHGRPVRLPHHAAGLLARWRRAEAALAGRLGRAPEPEEVGRALGLSPRKRALAEEALRLQRAGFLSVADEEEAPELIDERAGAERAAAEEGHRLRAALGRLGPREAAILRLRYGLGEGDGSGDGAALSQREVGRRLGGYSRQRICQLERQSIERLRAELA